MFERNAGIFAEEVACGVIVVDMRCARRGKLAHMSKGRSTLRISPSHTFASQKLSSLSLHQQFEAHFIVLETRA